MFNNTEKSRAGQAVGKKSALRLVAVQRLLRPVITTKRVYTTPVPHTQLWRRSLYFLCGRCKKTMFFFFLLDKRRKIMYVCCHCAAIVACASKQKKRFFTDSDNNIYTYGCLYFFHVHNDDHANVYDDALVCTGENEAVVL